MHGQQGEVGDVLALVGDRGAGQQLLQLGGRHQAAGERQAADDDLEAERRHLQAARGVRECRTYSAMPTRVAARAPSECDRAVRCGTAVIGMRRPMLPPTTAPIGQADADPDVAPAA